MLQTHANDIRSRLRLTASSLVIAAAGIGLFIGAGATPITLSGSNSPYDLTTNGTGNTVTITSGTTAELRPNYDTTPTYNAGDYVLTWPSPILTADSTCLYGGCTNANQINVASGGTLVIYNPWYWMELQSLINATGTVVFEPGANIGVLGTNFFNGDVVLADSAGVNFGEGWIYSSNYFGTATNIRMGAGTQITFNEPHTVLNVINTISSSAANAQITFNNGSMTVNGANTALSSFLGRVDINAGATFIVGDATHSSAVFGDLTGSTAVVSVNQSGGTVGTLKGYGTIYGVVGNAGTVTPGGTVGTLGTLTVHGDYTQTSLGKLVAEVGPTGASKLVVTGTATLAGSLTVKVDSGNYTTPGIYTILSAGTMSGSFSTVSVEGSASFVGTVRTATGYQAVVESQNSAQTFAHLATANRANVTQFSRALYDRVDTNAGDGKVVAWIAPYVGIENIGRSGIGYNNTTVGVRGGVEYHTSAQAGVIGLAASYGSSSMDVKGESSTADANTYNVAAYGGADLLYARVDGALFISKFDSTISRSIGTLGSVASAPEGSAYGATVQVSKNLFNDRITPYVSGYFARVHLDGVTETGSTNFALRYDAINRNYMAVDLGVKVHVIKQPGLKLDVNLAVERDFSDRGEKASASFANITGSSATYAWKGDSENTLVTGLYLAKSFTSQFDLFARVNGQFSLYRRAGDFSIGAKYRF